MAKKKPEGLDGKLTSYGDPAFSRYLRGAFLAGAGYDELDQERPVVGVVDTRSDFNPCHRQMPELVEAVKRGVLQAGGLPMVFPTLSLHELFVHPTTMLLRNLMAMATEEMIRAQPMDAVVLLGGCDKTVPALLMAALSADVPALMVVTGPMTSGSWRGERLGACTDCRRMWAKHRAGELSDDEIAQVERELVPVAGTCMVMGTASTLACVTETMGMMLPGGATPPSGSGARLRHAVASGRRAVELAVTGGPRPSEVVTKAALRNALVVLSAVSGSTNAIVHLAAVARRAGLTLSLDALTEVSAQVPVLVDCKPAGAGYLEDLHRAGGVPALLRELRPLLELEAVGVAGRTLGELLDEVDPLGDWQSTIRPLEAPLAPAGALVGLRGSLAPNGAVIKAAAATPSLLKHQGPAVVFDGPDDVAARIDDPSLEITPAHVLVMRNAGPVAAGMPEAGAIPIPRYLAEQGVSDMVRVSDARMSGTAYGTVVLHCAPEAAVGGPLALVRDGDEIELDVAAGRIDLLVGELELAKRCERWTAPPLPERGWRRLFALHVQQAELGADLDFL
jgi:dihydroxy-acid dehydratase